MSKRVKAVIGCDITFTDKAMNEGYDIPEYIPVMGKGNLDLLLRNGVFPHEYIDSIDHINETAFPPKFTFYSKLGGKGISDEDYEHAHTVWKEFGCETLRDYLELYNESDVLLLADVFENFRDVCMENYGLDPAWYYTAP